MDNFNPHLPNNVLGGRKPCNHVDKLLSLQEFESSEELSSMFLAPELQAQWLRPLQAVHGVFHLERPPLPPPPPPPPPPPHEAVEEVGSSTDDINPSMEEERKRCRNIDQDEDSGDSACASNNTLHGSPEDVIEAQHIYSHPLFMRFLTGHIECSKVGVADQAVVPHLDQLEEQYRALSTKSIAIGSHPDLDQFMVHYCTLLDSHREEMNKIFNETQGFLKTVEKTTEVIRMRDPSGLRNRVSSETIDMEIKLHAKIHAMMEERKQPTITKHQLTQISKVTKELKEEFNAQRTRKYSRLPEEATMILQQWWDKNYQVNPYPSKNDKVEFVRCTGLELKQIENWFSNQRKKLHEPSYKSGRQIT